jgi:hypothetical protein
MEISCPVHSHLGERRCEGSTHSLLVFLQIGSAFKPKLGGHSWQWSICTSTSTRLSQELPVTDSIRHVYRPVAHGGMICTDSTMIVQPALRPPLGLRPLA